MSRWASSSLHGWLLFLRARRWPGAVALLTLTSWVTLSTPSAVSVPLIEFPVLSASLWPSLAMLPAGLVSESALAAWERTARRDMMRAHWAQMAAFHGLAAAVVLSSGVPQWTNLAVVFSLLSAAASTGAALSGLPAWFFGFALSGMLLLQQGIVNWLEGEPSSPVTVVATAVIALLAQGWFARAWVRRFTDDGEP